MKPLCYVLAIGVLLLVGGIGPVFAGGTCAPELRAIEAKLAEMPNTQSKEKVRELYEAAKKAASNYDDERCMERAAEALKRIVSAKS